MTTPTHLDIFPAPQEMKAHEAFRVWVNEQKLFAYETEVFWEADQAPKKVAYCTFDFTGKVEICVTSDQTIQQARIHPLSLNIDTHICENTLTFTLDNPVKISVEINGNIDRTLMIFAGEPETHLPDLEDPELLYFPPGIHEITENEYGILTLKHKRKVYIAGGAVLRARIHAHHLKDIEIFGRGILDGSTLLSRHPEYHAERVGEAPGLDRPIFMDFIKCKNIKIEGIHFINTPHWTLRMVECNHVTCRNLKMIGSVENSDGIDIVNSRNVLIQDVFIRTADDCIAIKGKALHKQKKRSNISNIQVKNCTLWADRASALEIGHENEANKIHNIHFSNIDILMQRLNTIGYHALNIHNGDDANIYDVHYKNIRVERCQRLAGIKISKGYFNQAKAYGRVHDVSFKNIYSHDKHDLHLHGHNSEHEISNISFENLYLDGQPKTPEVFTNPFVENYDYRQDGKIIESFNTPLPRLNFTPIDLPEHPQEMRTFPQPAHFSKEHVQLSGIDFHLSPLHAVDLNGSGEKAPVPLQTKADYLFFLQICTNETSPIGTVIWIYNIIYEDDTHCTLACRYNLDISDCNTWASGGWMAELDKKKTYIQSLKNPHPDLQIKKIVPNKMNTPEQGMLLALSLGKRIDAS
ncbi:glycosyl hydrolase family 28 protein [Kiritimatiellota bacterium B12222]|nr:glycosyl hydrolase family 28 protein [Kiritimatiellota bacterium B12222]